MTERELSQIYFLNREIRFDLTEIQTLKRAITLKENDLKYKIEIEYLNFLIDQLEKKIEKCSLMQRRISQYIDGIEDDFLRKIIECRYIKRMSWESVAMMNGGYNTANGLREMVHRFLKRNSEAA